MAIAKLELLKQRAATDAVINKATPEQRAKLLANWVISAARMQLLLPDYSPVLLKMLPVLVGDCTHAELPFMEAAPVVCSHCRKQVGTIGGLATSTKSAFAHRECNFNFREPPWFITEGFNLIANAAFKNKHAAALLSHYIIMEYLRNEQRKRSCYEQTPCDGFEFITSLGTGQQEQVSSHDNTGGDELSAASSCNQLPLL